MRLTRVAAAATSLLLLGSVTSIGSAGAASTGVGTSKTSTTVLNVALGDAGSILNVKVLTDEAQSTIDSAANATPLAFSKLTAASVSSSKVSALNLGVPAPPLEARQPGGSADVNSAAIDLADPAGLLGAGVAVPVALPTALSGTVSLAHLTASAAADSAKSSLANSLTNLGVAGGLLTASGVSETSASNAAAAAAETTREAKIDAVTVLDLGSLLEGLGIQLTDLTVSQVDALLAATQTAVSGLAANTTLADTLDAVQTEVNALAAQVAANTGSLLDAAGVQGIVDGLGLDGVIDTTAVNDVAGVTTTVADQYNALIDTLRAGLADLLANALTALDATPLLKLDGVDIGVTTKAADTVANSLANVTAKVGGVNVGGIALPGLDLLQAAGALNSAVSTINSKISGALDSVQATVGANVISLKDLVTVTALKPTTSVTTANGYNVASAGVTALSAKITPPAQLADLVAAISGQDAAGTSIGKTITAATTAGGLAGSLPAMSGAMLDLQSVLGAANTALAQGATVDAVQVLGTSQYKAAVAPGTTTGSLPRTGGDAARLAALGFLLVALGLGFGRWFELPVPAVIRRRR
jgi:hypothetical protein